MASRADQPSSATIYEHLKTRDSRQAAGAASTPRQSATSPRREGGERRTFDASYRIPYIAHVPLEPRAAVAEWTDGKLTVWTGTQRPFGVRTELAQAFRMPEDRVRVIVPDTGSAYGGKHTGEHAIEAARLAKAAGKPVKLVWTRAEEFSCGYARPAGVIDVKAGVDADGRLIALGVRQLELRRVRHPHALRQSPTSASSSIRPTRRSARARIAGWPRPPTTTRARCTWTRSRARSASTPWSSA